MKLVDKVLYSRSSEHAQYLLKVDDVNEFFPIRSNVEEISFRIFVLFIFALISFLKLLNFLYIFFFVYIWKKY